MASQSSTPASSPARGVPSASPSRFDLSPESKVRALLASLDENSEEENSKGSARTRLVSAFNKSTSKKALVKSKDELLQVGPGHVHTAGSDNPEDDEEEEEVISRPKGRLAARMLDSESGSEGGATIKSPRRASAKPIERKSSSPTEDDSDRNDDPVVSRKRKVRVPRPSTPRLISRNNSTSPGLFVSPVVPRSATPNENASDSDELQTDPLVNDRFKALVEKKRQERLAKEKEAAAEKAKRLAERRQHNSMLDEDNDISDDNVERRLTQQAKPTRKASKRAQEEISRETQRMSRNMQLAHKAITKKKITKAMLFAKFNYKTSTAESPVELPRPSSSSSAAPHSDVEMRDTPPTSPATKSDMEKPAPSIVNSIVFAEEVEEDGGDLPDLQDALSRMRSPPRDLNKGKGKAIEETLPKPPPMPLFKQRPIRVRPPKGVSKRTAGLDDSESDLEIMTARTPDAKSKKLDSIFDRVPAKKSQESSSLYALRMLAHITSPGKQNARKDKRPSMTTSELQISLQQRARQQATREKEDRLQALRDKGVIVQTAEERQKETAEVEDLIAKARREGEEIMKKEKAAAKKERKDNGEVDPLGDSSDDEDWEEEKEKEQSAAELSGSDEEDDGSENDAEDEEEDDDEDVEMEEDAEASRSNVMFDEEADDTDDDHAESGLSSDEKMAEANDQIEDEELERPVQQRRRNRMAMVISDDEDENESIKNTPLAPRTKSPNQISTESPLAPNSVLRSASKTFIPGVSVAGPAGLGLTQIFAGTMDESQPDLSPAGSREYHEAIQTDSMAFLRGRSVPELPDFVPTMSNDTQDVVMDSQSGIHDVSASQNDESQTQPFQLQFSQSQIHGFDSLVDEPIATQFSELPDATQDAGFQHLTPIKGRFDAPSSTIDTVIIEPVREAGSILETPTVKRKGKLRRRAPQVASLSDDEDVAQSEAEAEAEDLEISANVFDVMRKASKKAIVVDEFDKKKSGAKEMVDEQADESEDEYAGLGGASDDESGGEEDAYAKEIIDDEGGKDVDERKLAAFFADRERANDEKQVEKLYNDITKGMLRRKRGADYDLSDSDDGGEARRRMKRKDFAKMRKALLADERIGKIAENPKRQAFLRAIEDRGSDDDLGFVDDFAEQEDTTDSQSQSQAEPLGPDSQPESMGPPKRKRSDEAIEAEQRPPPHLRRTKAAQKPSNLSEIRESLSSLIEEPNAMKVAESGSESEDELEIEGGAKDKENRDPFALRRTNIATIDRIALKRASSTSLSTSTRLAFAASSSAPGFKVPPLLRRATTNNSIASASSTTSSVSGMERLAGGQGEGVVKRGGGKNSGVNFFARENERRAAIVKTEKRLLQKRSRGAETRRKAVGGLFGGGKFE